MGTIAITGCASGIGSETREQLEAEGHEILGIDLHDAEIVADLGTLDGRRHALRQIEQRSGGCLDGLVLCAGLGPIAGTSALIVSVNYFGAVELLDGLRDLLEAGSDPAAVVVCSNSATTSPEIPEDLVALMLEGDEGSARWRAEEIHAAFAYAASKLALARAMRRRAPAWAQAGIRLNAVAPGATATPLLAKGLEDPELGDAIRNFPIPLGRFGTPPQIASAIRFLLGKDSSFCVGSVLFVDGGSDAVVRPDLF